MLLKERHIFSVQYTCLLNLFQLASDEIVLFLTVVSKQLVQVLVQLMEVPSRPYFSSLLSSAL